MPQLGLTRALGAEQIQDGEARRDVRDDVLEEGGQQEAEANLGVVAIYRHHEAHVVLQGDVVRLQVRELAVDLISLGIRRRVGCAAGEIEPAVVHLEDAILVRLHEMVSVQASVAEGVEPPALLPSQLPDLVGRRGVVVQVGLQLGELGGRHLPDVVAGRFQDPLEVREGNQLALLELDDFLVAGVVDDAEDSAGVPLVPDVQDRLHDEVAPGAVGRRSSGTVVTPALDIEPIAGQHVLGLVVLVDLLPLPGVLRLEVFLSPDLPVLVLLREGVQEHLHGGRVAVRQQLGDVRDDGRHLSLGGLPGHQVLGVPRDEVERVAGHHLVPSVREPQEVFIRVLRIRRFHLRGVGPPDDPDTHPSLDEVDAVLDAGLDAGLVHVAGEDDALDLAGLQELDVFVGQCGPAGRDSVGDADLREAQHVRISFADDDRLRDGHLPRRLVPAEQDCPFLIDGCLGRVQVLDFLGHFRIVADVAAGESDQLAGRAVEREDQALAEGVIVAAILADLHKPGFLQDLALPALAGHVLI